MIRQKPKFREWIDGHGRKRYEGYGGSHPFLNLEDVPNPEDYEQVEEEKSGDSESANDYWLSAPFKIKIEAQSAQLMEIQELLGVKGFPAVIAKIKSLLEARG